MFEDKRGKPGERFFGIADGAVFIGIGIFHQNRAGAIGAQPRTHRPVAFPQTFVIAAYLRPYRIDSTAPGTGVVTMFAQFAGGFREFGDFENLATEAAFATGFSGDCKHERLASATRFDNLDFVIGKALAQEESQQAAFFRAKIFIPDTIPRGGAACAMARRPRRSLPLRTNMSRASPFLAKSRLNEILVREMEAG
jgi:hypothetical protein